MQCFDGQSDSVLVAAAKNGVNRAFEVLVERHKARIFSSAFYITHNREDAQDVVQQSFQKAFVYLQTFRGRSSFSTWLTRIAINEALMSKRKNRSLSPVSLEEMGTEPEIALAMAIPDAGASPEEIYGQREREQILSLLMNQLPPRLQATMRLHLDDRTVKETGEIVGVRIPAVKARLFRGRQKMRELLKRYVQSTRKPTGGKLQNAAWYK